jgi:uncharacterized protein YybS (DUF2232 family)
MLSAIKGILNTPNQWLPLAVAGTTLFFSTFLLLQVSPTLILLSMIPMLLSPVFVVITTWRHGNRLGLAASITSAVFVLLLFNLPILVLFAFQFALVGILLGEGLRKRVAALPLLFATAFASTALIVLLGAVYLSGSPGGLSGAFQAGAEAARTAFEAQARHYGLDPEELMRYQRAVSGLIDFVKVALPGLIFFNAFTIVYLNLVVSAGLSAPLGLDGSHVAPLREMAVPAAWIWGLILSGLLYLLKVPYLKWVGLNAGLVFLLAYLLQGYAILSFYLHRTRLPGLFKGLIYALFLMHPLLMILLCAVGLFETWIPFRRRASG